MTGGEEKEKEKKSLSRNARQLGEIMPRKHNLCPVVWYFFGERL